MWLQQGNTGTEQDFLNSLIGKDGSNGIDGKDGVTPQKGTDYWTDEDVSNIKLYCDEYIDSKITQAIGGAY